MLVLTGAIVMLLSVVNVAAEGTQQQASRTSAHFDFQGEIHDQEQADFDNRAGTRNPSAAQEAAAARLGAEVNWNRFGTPQTLIKHGGYLATGLPADAEAAARRFLSTNSVLFGLSKGEVAALDLRRHARMGGASSITLQQSFGGLDASPDGLITVGVKDGKVAFASSSLAPNQGNPDSAELTAEEALLIAADDSELNVDSNDIERSGSARGWTRFKSDELTHTQLARLVAVPTPTDGVRVSYETFVINNVAEPVAFTHYIDAVTGDVLIRSHAVDHLQADDPSRWTVFENTPPMDYSSTDSRVLWCWTASSPDCDRVVANDAARVPWDFDARLNTSTLTSRGNQARTTENWFSNNPFSVGVNFATPRPDRNYSYAWTNQWLEERCNPDTTFTSPARNDIDAAIANLFVMHNRMHDWSYFLGFTEENSNLQDFNFGEGGRENDPEHGNAQAGGVSGGPPTYAARDNANQITPPDGSLPITNMYLWQPIPGAFYSPCVDGDYDMSVIGHEYTHAITNRMIAGPDVGLSGPQGGAMGESWSDLAAIEYLHEYDFVPVADENPFAVGPYVTGDPTAGIRNYGMNDSPLNYSDIEYDLVGQQVHADGEIWSATNYDIREGLNDRYDSSFPSSDDALQESCADGELDAEECSGNRRWAQLMFDSYLLMPVTPSMVDARNALLAADVLRFGGANQDVLWNAFARRGLGVGASSNTSADANPVPSFESDHANNATVVWRANATGGQNPANAELLLGDYEARVMPVADRDPSTPTDHTFEIVPGTYDFIARADGYGATRFTFSFRPGRRVNLNTTLDRNFASIHNGATASGDGVNLELLIDDTEETNWASREGAVQGKEVTVELERRTQVRRVNVSAMLRPPFPPPPAPQPPDPGTQNRYSALRQFEILTCNTSNNVDCTDAADFEVVLTSPADAFPSVAPRPRAPELILREFAVEASKATHVRLRVLHNQCTGGPDYQGDQDDDPRHITDCDEGSTQGTFVRAAELQVFSNR
jgi:extracellular elastinolytic metalloproteinase